MFDISFWELVLIAVVALLVVGPDRFPGLVRDIGVWMRKARRFATSVKAEFDRELNKAEELKRAMAREAEIAEQHKTVDKSKPTVPTRTGAGAGAETPAKESAAAASDETRSGSATDRPPNVPPE